MMLPKSGEIYQSRKTGQQYYVLGHKRNQAKHAQSQYDIGLLCVKRHIYSEIPFSWFQSLYFKVRDAAPLPELEVIFYYQKRLLPQDVNHESHYSQYL
ncbi:hypothetical protein [Providencia manganoxydans]|uniref:hypothetical protein n=1 Tax=Providencia manganoxydans TaxID=2923283 RepID=UPI0034E60F62